MGERGTLPDKCFKTLPQPLQRRGVKSIRPAVWEKRKKKGELPVTLFSLFLFFRVDFLVELSQSIGGARLTGQGLAERLIISSLVEIIRDAFKHKFEVAVLDVRQRFDVFLETDLAVLTGAKEVTFKKNLTNFFDFRHCGTGDIPQQLVVALVVKFLKGGELAEIFEKAGVDIDADPHDFGRRHTNTLLSGNAQIELGQITAACMRRRGGSGGLTDARDVEVILVNVAAFVPLVVVQIFGPDGMELTAEIVEIVRQLEIIVIQPDEDDGIYVFPLLHKRLYPSEEGGEYVSGIFSVFRKDLHQIRLLQTHGLRITPHEPPVPEGFVVGHLPERTGVVHNGFYVNGNGLKTTTEFLQAGFTMFLEH